MCNFQNLSHFLTISLRARIQLCVYFCLWYFSCSGTTTCWVEVLNMQQSRRAAYLVQGPSFLCASSVTVCRRGNAPLLNPLTVHNGCFTFSILLYSDIKTVLSQTQNSNNETEMKTAPEISVSWVFVSSHLLLQRLLHDELLRVSDALQSDPQEHACWRAVPLCYIYTRTQLITWLLRYGSK